MADGKGVATLRAMSGRGVSSFRFPLWHIVCMMAVVNVVSGSEADRISSHYDLPEKSERIVSGWTFFILVNVVVLSAVAFKNRTAIAEFLGTEIAEENKRLEKKVQSLRKQVEDEVLSHQNKTLKQEQHIAEHSDEVAEKLKEAAQQNLQLEATLRDTKDQCDKGVKEIAAVKAELEHMRIQLEEKKEASTSALKTVDAADLQKDALLKLKEENEEMKSQVKLYRVNLRTVEKDLDTVRVQLREKDHILEARKDESRRKLEGLERLRVQELQQSNEDIETLKKRVIKLEELVLSLKEPAGKELVDTPAPSPQMEEMIDPVEEVISTPTFQTPTTMETPQSYEEQEPVQTLGGISENTKLNIPDELTDLLGPGEEFDILSLKKASKTKPFNTAPVKKKQGRIRGLNVQDVFQEGEFGDLPEDAMALLTQASTREPETPYIQPTELQTPEPQTTEAPRQSTPSFLNIFQTHIPIPVAQAEPKVLNRKPWAPGEPIIKEHSVQEDINKRGMRKSKKRSQVWQGSGKVEMEDQHSILFPFANDKKKALFCVFDGHAGKNCAVTAISTFPKEFEREIAHTSERNLSLAYKQAYLQTDQLLREFEYEGCTATSVFVWEDAGTRYMQAANVGDSSALLIRGKTVVWLTKDHKPTEASERERLISSGVELSENQTRVGGLAVSRALGDHFLKEENLGVIAEPHTSELLELTDEDSVLLIASDGLWDVMTGERALQLCSGLSGADAMARRLIQTAMADSKCTDNITVMIALL